MSTHNEAPINPLPPVVAAMTLILAGIEAYFSLGASGFLGGPEAVGWRAEAWERFAFSGVVFDWMVQNGRFPLEHMIRFVSYPFIHLTFTHALFAIVLFLAMGKFVAEAIGGVPMLLVFLASSIMGALAFGVVLNDPIPLIGAYPPVYGLIGAFTFLLWLRLGQLGQQQIRAFSLIALLLLVQLVFSLLFGGTNDWLADVAGFVTGFLLTVLLVPGGWARLFAWLRRD